VGVVFASKARYGQGPAAAGVVRWGVAGRVSGVPQRGAAYQLGVKPWVRDKPNRCVLKERGSGDQNFSPSIPVKVTVRPAICRV
ncbi:MAG: hypothetical protein RIS24_3501, partial [Verrucomicrobiota bacterium]